MDRGWERDWKSKHTCRVVRWRGREGRDTEGGTLRIYAYRGGREGMMGGVMKEGGSYLGREGGSTREKEKRTKLPSKIMQI